jgi:hypothetical protein
VAQLLEMRILLGHKLILNSACQQDSLHPSHSPYVTGSKRQLDVSGVMGQCARRRKMSNMTLTNDEKRCLQMWFRQAIVQLEKEEAKASIAKFYAGEVKTRDSHKAPVSPRRTRRTTRTTHKELV